MAFRQPVAPARVPESPEALFRMLPLRTIPDVLPHQEEMMRAYVSKALDMPDVALQLPTGSGKTLVGLLIAEWRRRKYEERIVYLCPTKQLVNQVVEQAEEKYGLTVLGFTGRAKYYDQTAKAQYLTAKSVAVTTYSSLFNTYPFFDNAEVLIVDDVHAAENYVSELWSLRVERQAPAHATLHTALRNVIKPLLDSHDFARLSGKRDSPVDLEWVDKIPTPEFIKIASEAIEVLDVHVRNTGLEYSWSMIRDHLDACHVYISSQDILIRPLIPPTWSHAPFVDPRQRIYMSATLGAGGDLERLTGRPSIHRLKTPEGWDRQGVGRRFFIFPGMSSGINDISALRMKLMHRAERSLVLVPSGSLADKIAEEVKDNLSFRIFRADTIESSKKSFTAEPQAVAIVANRYDGIDFPREECRLLFIEGLPKATNLQERFIMTRMGANVLFNERVQTRVLQAIGRCTRSLEDYSAVVISGEEITSYLADPPRRKFLHPELQAEISFGLEQSTAVSFEDVVENVDIFLKHDKTWEDVDQQIIAFRDKSIQSDFPAIDELSHVVAYEIDFQKQLWDGDYEAALGSAERVLGRLNAQELRGYRALWHYLAGSAAQRGADAGVCGLQEKAHMQFSKAKSASSSIRWLAKLTRSQNEEPASSQESPILMGQIERVEIILEQLGTAHDSRFAQREKKILDGLESITKGRFEEAHKLLGEMLGYTANNVETEGSPDPWWIAGTVCLVFEDHAGAQHTSALDVTKARQVSSHPAWMRENVKESAEAAILPVLITPVKKVKQSAVAYLKDVALWPLDEFRSWAANALATIRQLRGPFVQPGDLGWRETAAKEFKQAGLDAPGLREKLRSQPVAGSLEPV